MEDAYGCILDTCIELLKGERLCDLDYANDLAYGTRAICTSLTRFVAPIGMCFVYWKSSFTTRLDASDSNRGTQ